MLTFRAHLFSPHLAFALEAFVHLYAACFCFFSSSFGDKIKNWQGLQIDRFLISLCVLESTFFSYRKGYPPRMVEIHGKWSGLGKC